jgi:butyrate kinase
MSILVINPGSTSTKLALFEGDQAVASEELQHDHNDLDRFERVADQFDFRMQALLGFLEKTGTDRSSIEAVAGRGGLLRPLDGGVYEVSDKMVSDLKSAPYGEHPCNLGGMLALSLARQWGVPAYVVDPAVTDEMMDRARLTGLPGLERRSLFHALNQRGVARLVAERLGVEYESSNFIVCHMGGGVSIGAHRLGRVVDVVNGLDGEGPFTPERTGGLPVVPVLNMVSSGERSADDIRHAVLKQGGMFALLGTNDPRETVARIEAGDERAGLVFRSMAYGIARYVASMIPALVSGNGELSIDAIILTGGLARSRPLMEEVISLVSPFGRVEIVPGEVEMQALASGAMRALKDAAVVRKYG